MHRRSRALPSPRAIVCALLLVAMLAITLPAPAAQPVSPASLPAPAAESARLPDALLPRVNASFAADDPAYAVFALPDDATTLEAANPAHRLTTTFAPAGVVTFAGEQDARWSLRLASIGSDAVSPTLAPVIAGGRVEYRRGNVTEWYVNGPLGVEQGFTLAAPPTAGDALALTLGVGDGATPRLDGSEVTLTVPGGEEMRYGHLLVTDATGRQLPARLSVAGDTITIVADLAGASYPVTVDPLVQMMRLTASDGTAYDNFGFSIAMSGDGARMIIGASTKTVGANTGQGVAYVYSGTNYATETRLALSDGAVNDYFGYSVAMSTDGTKVVVGAPFKTTGANSAQGAAYVYSGVGYTVQKKLLVSDGAANDFFGYSVAISDDGTRVVVGANQKMIGVNAYQGGRTSTAGRTTRPSSD